MPNRRPILWLLAAAGVVVFVFGLLRLLLLRFEAGDIYPPYSSLRADPLGTKVLYQSLAELSGASVRRNFLPLGRRKLRAAKGATLLYLGARPTLSPFLVGLTDASDDEDRDAPDDDGEPAAPLVEFVSGGGRLVISLSPEANLPGIQSSLDPLMREFGFHVDADEPTDEPPDEPMVAVPALRSEASGSETGAGPVDARGVSWHTPWYFKDLKPPWRSVYVCNGKPVIIERRFREGSVVVCSDTYFLSNEAMLKERRPRLLARLVGGREVIFDETHLGAVQESGIATLGREYNLAGLFGVLVLLAGLFVWKNAVTFLPRSAVRAEQLSGAGVAGRGSAAGLLNLLRKSIPPRNVLAVCFTEWARSPGAGRPVRGDARKRIEAIVRAEQARPAKQADVVAAYRSICRILSERT